MKVFLTFRVVAMETMWRSGGVAFYWMGGFAKGACWRVSLIFSDSPAGIARVPGGDSREAYEYSSIIFK